MPAQQDLTQLRNRLKLKVINSEQQLRLNHPKSVELLEGHGLKLGKLRSHAAKLLTTSTLASTLLLSSGQSSSPVPLSASDSIPTISSSFTNLTTSLSSQLSQVLPQEVKDLNEEQQSLVSNLLKEKLGITATAELQGERLNRNYGYIGQEQHLKRFPSDTLNQHSEPLREGMAPGLGAWGYFAPSSSELTPELEAIEKYYLAVQTLYISDWNTRTNFLKNWWKYRKMVVVNPKNGRVMIAAVGDAGPAWWTGKQFGGSPEVMEYLKMKDGKQKGAVIMFFLNDPQNSIPLGPLEYNLQSTSIPS